MQGEPSGEVDPTMWTGLLHAGVTGTFMRLPFVEAREESLRAVGATVGFLGFPWDSTCISRTGANYGPKSIREASEQFLFFNASTEMDLTDHFVMVDCSDVPVIPGNTETSMRRAQALLTEILNADAMPVMLGGDHSVTIAGVRAFASRAKHPGLILIDTHFDTAQDMGGELLNHCCPISRAVDAGFDPHRIAIIGPGGWMNPRSELEYLRQHGMALFTIEDVVAQGPTAVAQAATAVASAGSDGIYLTIDIDALDAAYAPGTGVPTPGGMTSREMIAIVSQVSRQGLGAVDLVEVSPAWDKDGITSRLACRVLLEALAGHASA
jgi:agmatinase